MSAILQAFACVTMIDVGEGDCYIVDLLNKDHASLADPKSAANWIRYLIDTGSFSDDRQKRIMIALTDHNEINPWSKPDFDTNGLPMLSGVIITHSDRDHSGNVSNVLDRALLPAYKPSIFAEKTSKLLHEVPVHVSPMVQWTRDLTSEKKVPEFIRIQSFRNLEMEIETYREGEIGVELVDMPLTVDRSFPNLKALCSIGDYTLQYRFNLLKSGSDLEFLKTKQAKGPLESKDVPYMVWQSDWQDSNRKHLNSLLAPIWEKPAIPLYPLNILVEVALVPRQNDQRTLPSDTYNKKVTGSWLRTVCKLDQGGKFIPEPPKIISLEKYLSNFRVQLINHHIKYNKLLEQGPWSASVMGCADEDFVRDFQHLVLQSTVSNEIPGLKSEYRENLWSEYANRASIINFFTFHPSIMQQEDGPPQAPYEDRGDFKMLFTGDAFELSEGLEKMTAVRQAWKIPQNTLLDMGFGIKPVAVSTKGNIMNWLSGQQAQNQQVDLDILKVPHHGSGVTSDPTLYAFVTASVYLISGSYSVHKHPTTQTMYHIISSIWQRDGKKVAKPPKLYRSMNPKSETNTPISERPRPRLIFMSFGTTKGRDSFDQSDLGKLCKRPDGWVNVKWFVQKAISQQNKSIPEAGRSGRLKFGRDKTRDHSLRVEWDTAAWEELRPDGLKRNLCNTEEDPLAYPLPDTSPTWEAPAPSVG